MPNKESVFLEKAQERERLRRRIVDMRQRAVSWREIADSLGLAIQTCRNHYIDAVTTLIPDEEREEILKIELDKLDNSEAETRDRIDAIKKYATALIEKKEMIRDGQHARDPMAWAIENIRKEEDLLNVIRTRRARLGGLDTPNLVLHAHKHKIDSNPELDALVAMLSGGGLIVSEPDRVIDDDSI